MKNTNIRNFAILALVLVVAFLFTNNKSRPSNGNTTVFSDFDWGKVAKVKIEKGAESIEIVKESDQKWVVPTRENFTANSAEITALTLKMADLSASQKINLNEDGLKRLGLTEESKDAGQGSITFFDVAGVELDRIFIGGLRNRKNSAPEDTANLAGQFVKRKSVEDSFLVPNPIMVYPTLATWLDTEIVSVADSDVKKVSSYIGGKEIFSLDRDDSTKKLVFKGTVPAGQVLQDTVVTQVSGGIKDVKLADVLKADSEVAKTLSFDKYIVYTLDNGLKYKIEVAEKEAKKYIKVSVSYEIAPADEAQPDASPAETKTTKSSKDVADKLNTKYGPWVYEVPEYVATRYLRKFEDLFKAPVEPSKGPAGVPGHAEVDMPESEMVGPEGT